MESKSTAIKIYTVAMSVEKRHADIVKVMTVVFFH